MGLFNTYKSNKNVRCPTNFCHEDCPSQQSQQDDQGVLRPRHEEGCLVGATVLMVNPAFAATIKLRGDNGELGFFPSSVTVSKGETVKFVNNKAFPHNVVFDEDAVPDGVDADKISHEDYLNGPGEKVSNKFDTAGTYEFYCEPHQGAACKARSSSTKFINYIRL